MRGKLKPPHDLAAMTAWSAGPWAEVTWPGLLLYVVHVGPRGMAVFHFTPHEPPEPPKTQPA